MEQPAVPPVSGGLSPTARTLLAMTPAHPHERRPSESTGLVADAIAEAESIRSRPGPLIPHDVVEAMMGADAEVHDAMAVALDERATENLSPDSVRAMWEAVKSRHGSA